MAEDGDELGFAALASRRGGNRRGSETRHKREATEYKRPRLSQPPSRGNNSRPPTAAIAQNGAQSGGVETLDRGGEVQRKSEMMNDMGTGLGFGPLKIQRKIDMLNEIGLGSGPLETKLLPDMGWIRIDWSDP
ncbi:hypothetical protein CASFOL_042818 [Castilleja foliolosa]|uniref:Uncharacterized protein n=1 Tax=Castilleja foliolosa TaxID=1961234 RepID=A0ABD3B895_9LAMI